MSVDYVIEVADVSWASGAGSIATFGREEFTDALARYLEVKKKDPSARLLKVLQNGWIMVPVIGYVMTHPWRKPRAKWRREKGRHVIGWNRIEPYDTGTRYWGTDEHERAAMFPKRTVAHTSVKPIYTAAERRRLLQQAAERRARERERRDSIRRWTEMDDWNGQGMNEDGDLT